MTSAAPVTGASPPAERLDSGVLCLLENESLICPLGAKTDGAAAPSFPWHRPVRLPGLPLQLQSAEGQMNRLVRLAVASSAPGFHERWLRWSFLPRVRSEQEGGSALSAHDKLNEDGRELFLLLVGGETRRITLEFCGCLDDETAAGDYLFQVICSDRETGAVLDRKDAVLHLRHPRSRLLDALPVAYREESDAYDLQNQSNSSGHAALSPAAAQFQDRPFIDRMLMGYDDSVQPLRDMINNLFRLFDPKQTPADFLPWLGMWLSMALDDNWSELRRRRLLSEAVELYRRRGTRQGLQRFLEIYTGVAPIIYDRPLSGMRLGPNAVLGARPGGLLGHIRDHAFVVTLTLPDQEAVNERTVRDIIEMSKPAHTDYELRIVKRRDDTA